MAIMASFQIFCAAPALLLAAALLAMAAGAGADWATVEQCRGVHSDRVRDYPGDSSATHLWMGGCGVTEVKSTDIANLQEVQYIYLHVNSITHFNTSALRTVPALTELHLNSNKFREPPVFAAGSCDRLTKLYLHYNLLTALTDEGTFSACRKLSVLYLHHNQIQYLHKDIFKSLVELQLLFLEDNKITFIHKNMFKNNSKLKTLLLYNNRFTHLPPEFASSLKRAGARLQSFYFFDNPWHCACLVEFRMDMMRAGVRDYDGGYYWNSHKYNGYKPECVFSGAEPCCRRAPAGLEDFSSHRNPWHCACLVEAVMDARRAGVEYSVDSHSHDGTRPVCVYGGQMRAGAGAGAGGAR